jgi:hypothetical protein
MDKNGMENGHPGGYELIICLCLSFKSSFIINRQIINFVHSKEEINRKTYAMECNKFHFS